MCKLAVPQSAAIGILFLSFIHVLIDEETEARMKEDLLHLNIKWAH